MVEDGLLDETSGLHNNPIRVKTKRVVQPAARDIPDLHYKKKCQPAGQCECYSWLSHRMNTHTGQTECYNWFGLRMNTSGWHNKNKIKTKKCQPAARDIPDLIQTECVPDSWLACPKNKNKLNRKKRKKRDCTNVTIAIVDKLTRSTEAAPVPISPPPPQLHSPGNKIRNKNVKMVNGKNTLTISHWNLGAELWQNKQIAIQAAVDTQKPDMLFISEANLHESTPVWETMITGYTIHKPLTVRVHNLSRLVLLVRDKVDVQIEECLMDSSITSFWIKIAQPGMKKILICGICREHQYLYQPDDHSLHPLE